MINSDKFIQLGEDTKMRISEIVEKMGLPVSVEILYIGNNKSKNLIEVKKLPDDIAFATQCHIKCVVNELMFDDMIGDAKGELAIQVLVAQAIEKITFDFNTGKVKNNKVEVKTTEGVLKKYGWDTVKEVQELEKLLFDQHKDREETDSINIES